MRTPILRFFGKVASEQPGAQISPGNVAVDLSLQEPSAALGVSMPPQGQELSISVDDAFLSVTDTLTPDFIQVSTGLWDSPLTIALQTATPDNVGIELVLSDVVSHQASYLSAYDLSANVYINDAGVLLGYPLDPLDAVVDSFVDLAAVSFHITLYPATVSIDAHVLSPWVLDDSVTFDIGFKLTICKEFTMHINITTSVDVKGVI